MARKYSKSASKDVEREMRKFNRGTLKSGKGGKGGTHGQEPEASHCHWSVGSAQEGQESAEK